MLSGVGLVNAAVDDSSLQRFRDALVVFREAVRKSDVLDTGYLSEELMNKLARNTGAIPAHEQQFFLALRVCSRNHHGDVSHEDFNECFKIALGYAKLTFEERLENNQVIDIFPHSSTGKLNFLYYTGCQRDEHRPFSGGHTELWSSSRVNNSPNRC